MIFEMELCKNKEELMNCTIQLHDRDLRTSTQWQRSVLSLETKIYYYKIKTYLVLEREEKNNVKYLMTAYDRFYFRHNLKETDIKNFIQKKHINNFTIYFKIPPHNLVIQSTDDASFEKFKNLVLDMYSRQWCYYEECSGPKPNFTLEITQYVNKKTYPPTEDFPRKTEKIILRELNITELNAQTILNFYSLRTLTLSNNQISFLPKELGTLPHLEKLFLSHNCLGNTCLEIAKWEWMEQTAISQSLKLLDIHNNNLTELPLQIGKLQNLLSLDVSKNLLTKVPQIIGILHQLKRLDVSTNLLSYLPGSMRGMELYYLGVEHNPFKDLRNLCLTQTLLNADDYRSPTLKVVSLLDLAAKTIKNYRIPYNNLPSKLARYLDNSKYCCICRNPCFHSDIKDFKLLIDRQIPFNRNVNRLSDVCQNININTPSNEYIRRILFKCYFCSSQCYFNFCKIY